MEYYILGYKGRNVEISEEEAIERELAGQQVFVKRGEITEYEKNLIRDKVGMN